MKKTSTLYGASMLALSVASVLAIAAPEHAYAQTAPAAGEAPAEEVIIVTGSRRAVRPVSFLGCRRLCCLHAWLAPTCEAPLHACCRAATCGQQPQTAPGDTNSQTTAHAD